MSCISSIMWSATFSVPCICQFPKSHSRTRESASYAFSRFERPDCSPHNAFDRQPYLSECLRAERAERILVFSERCGIFDLSVVAIRGNYPEYHTAIRQEIDNNPIRMVSATFLKLSVSKCLSSLDVYRLHLQVLSQPLLKVGKPNTLFERQTI